ncbi:hypothetical protein AL542_09910 [Grimontia hollisae]|nr:hypothetical protein AL542_09475 [Grimontia hollisae]AMG30654.1 hypothetical protein AL542_09910 [Grimontia hollisae]STO47725.1 Uncharacterised protein [Grimontia hollisae]
MLLLAPSKHLVDLPLGVIFPSKRAAILLIYLNASSVYFDSVFKAFAVPVWMGISALEAALRVGEAAL